MCPIEALYAELRHPKNDNSSQVFETRSTFKYRPHQINPKMLGGNKTSSSGKRDSLENNYVQSAYSDVLHGDTVDL